MKKKIDTKIVAPAAEIVEDNLKIKKKKKDRTTASEIPDQIPVINVVEVDSKKKSKKKRSKEPEFVASDLLLLVLKYLQQCGYTNTSTNLLAEAFPANYTVDLKLLDEDLVSIYGSYKKLSRAPERETTAVSISNHLPSTVDDINSRSNKTKKSSSISEEIIVPPVVLDDKKSSLKKEKKIKEEPVTERKPKSEEKTRSKLSTKVTPVESNDESSSSSSSSSDSDSDSSDSSESDDEKKQEAAELKRLEKKEMERKQKAAAAAKAAQEWAEKTNAEQTSGKKSKKRKLNSTEGDELEENGEGRKSGEAFKRVDSEFWSSQIKQGLEDNSYVKQFGEDGYGAKANKVLIAVKGKDFRHEKTKKKRGSYRGGEITLASNSFKYED